LLPPDDFELDLQKLGIPLDAKGDTVGATWGAISGPTLASGSHPPSPSRPATSTLPQLEIATPHAARADASTVELTPLEILGEGGMGQVLVARQWSLEREVAVKVLKNTATDEAARALVDEARIAGALEHPGVVPVYALARDAQGLPAVVMKRVEGTSWEALLREPEHPAWSRVAPVGKDRLEVHLGILVQVCNALAFAHRRGVLHRDLKPANVLVGELGEVYLADWGIAIRKGAAPEQKLVGTPAYMAPEMVHAALGPVDERTDVYLVGATLYDVLTGAPPHASTELKDALERAWSSAPKTFPGNVPAELSGICSRCMSRQPSGRFADVLAVRDALLAFLQHRGSLRLTETATERLALLERAVRDDETKVHALLLECRFAFTQALREWPENHAARDGLRRTIVLGVQHALEVGDPRGARVLFAELADPPPELQAALTQKESEHAAARTRSLELERQAQENDPRLGAAARNRLAIGLGLWVLATFLLFRFGLRDFLLARIGDWMRVVPMLVLLVVMTIAVVLGRRSLLASRLNRQLVLSVAGGMIGVVLSRCIAILSRTPVSVSFAIDCVLLAVALGVAAVFTHWSLLGCSVILIGGSVACYFAPDEAISVFALTGVASLMYLAFSWRVWRESAR
jgi:eukaryotic-like serine/threonine-protein kinase